MSLTLLEQLMAKSEATINQVKAAQAELTNEEPLTEFIGVNAPENTQDLAPELVEQVEAPAPVIEQVEEMEAAFEQQPKKAISIPMHDDGLDDEPPTLTSSHTRKAASATEQTTSAVQEFVQASQPTQEDEETEDTPTVPFKEDTWEDIEEPTPEFEESEEMNAVNNAKADEQEESNLWNEKPFSSRYFNFGGRTVNSLTKRVTLVLTHLWYGIQ